MKIEEFQEKLKNKVNDTIKCFEELAGIMEEIDDVDVSEIKPEEQSGVISGVAAEMIRLQIEIERVFKKAS